MTAARQSMCVLVHERQRVFARHLRATELRIFSPAMPAVGLGLRSADLDNEYASHTAPRLHAAERERKLSG